jgi:hypothetical protein
LAWGWHGVGMGLAWGWHGVSMGLAWAAWGRMGINLQDPCLLHCLQVVAQLFMVLGSGRSSATQCLVSWAPSRGLTLWLRGLRGG